MPFDRVIGEMKLVAPSFRILKPLLTMIADEA